MFRAIGRFLLLASEPVNRWAGRGQVIGVPIASVAAIVGFAWRLGPWPAVALGLGIISGLLGVAGVRLQREKDHRKAARYDFSASRDLISGQVSVNDRTFNDQAAFWVTVRNDGPTSEFAARIPHVAGIPQGWGKDYRILHPAWEQSPASELRIPGLSGERRLMLASVMLKPRAFWFYTSQFGRQEAGNQFLIDEWLSPDETVEIDFELEVINTGDKDQRRTKIGHITIPPVADAMPTLTLTEAP